MKKQPAMRSMTAITLLLALSILGLWLVSCLCLTVVTAQQIYDELYEVGTGYAAYVSRYSSIADFYDSAYSLYRRQEDRPDYLEHQMLRAISRYSSASYHTGGHYDDGSRTKLIREISYPLDAAVLFYDADGTLLHSSRDALLYFNYFTQAEWDAGADSASGLHYGWIDISEGKAGPWQDDPYLRLRTLYAGTHSLWDIPCIRVAGYFEGPRLIPVTMHYVTETMVVQAIDGDSRFSNGEGGYTYILSDVDRAGLLDWQLQFDRSADAAGRELVTVYLDRPELWDYNGSTSRYGDQTYETLADLAQAVLPPSGDYQETARRSIFKLTDLLVFSRWTAFDTDPARDADPQLYLVAAVRGSPLACAASALRNLYLASLLLALCLLFGVRRSIQRHLAAPAAALAGAMERGASSPYPLGETPPMWREARALCEGFSAGQDRLRRQENEIARLSTALSYADAAERSRRRMVSAIAHELKTPLAVIHSYAEGLKEHIAEDKREQYIDVILSEAERTDAMVLELLDLSRLEAGRVKLSRDQFSLAALGRAAFEKLSPLAQAKGLRIDLSLPDDLIVTADESRMAQVIENLASNAIRYTPEGGHIQARLRPQGSGAAFSIENDSPPLSEDALLHVWDAFYQADSSRSGGGTGLGLAIVKGIVELHGGRCFARNTASGVEFGFTI